jgi:catechol 2,3-dioxygenase-like lactoylglutathione lyase family enzyme
MLGTIDAIATVAVKNLDAAKRFYEGTLGLKPVSAEDSEAITYRAGSSTLLVYRSQYAGTNEATAVTWIVGDGLEDLVTALKGKGVAFERYDLPGTTRKGDVHVAGNTKVAWFKDPDGNIHSLVNG